MLYFHFDNLLQSGELWVLLAAAFLFQLHYLRDALSSKYNNGQKHSISFPLWIKVAVPSLSAFITLAFAMMGIFRTTEPDDSLDIAASIWVEVIAWFGWLWERLLL